MELIPLNDREFESLLKDMAHVSPVNVAFGPGWVALEHIDGDDPVYDRLMLMRGVSNENTAGAGI